MAPKQPDGTTITTNVDTRIIKAAEWNDTIVASHAIGVSATEDDARWYAIDVSSGTPTLADQGNVSAGNNHYIVYPSVDINAAGDIGMTYLQSGTGAGQYMSMYVTGRNAADAAGTMQTPVLVKAGVANEAGGREGDLSGINVDANGSFWAVNEWAADPAQTSTFANWSTAIANFVLGTAPTVTPPADQDAVAGVSQGFDLGSFADPDGGPWSVTVTWGDGTPDDLFNAPAAGSLGILPHNYALPGPFTVTVEVQDGTSLSDTKTFHVDVAEAVQVVGRHVFYNDSAFDGSASNNAGDDAAIPSNKTAYLPGDGQMVLANITNFTKGLNGIMVDLTVGSADHTTINASDFVFKVGENNSPNTWTTLTATPTISVRTGAGTSGSDRVDITWADNAIQDQYLEVQVLATAHTGLNPTFGTISGNAVGDIFFFGNLRGETASTTPASFARIFASDGAAIQANGTSVNVGINSFLDVDRSNAVISAGDRAALLPLGTKALVRISIGTAGPFAPEGNVGDVGIASALAGTATTSPVTNGTSVVSLPPGIANRLEKPVSNRGQIAAFFQHLAEAENSSRRSARGLGHWSPFEVDVDLDDELLEILSDR